MAIYQSEYEKFLNDMHKRHPEWVNEQRKGLNLLWGKKVVSADQRYSSNEIEKQRPYPYDVNFR